MEFKIVAVHFFSKSSKLCSCVCQKASWILIERIERYILEKKKTERKSKNYFAALGGGGGGGYTGPSIDVSCNEGSVTSHKMKLFITPLPPKEGTEHGENETY